MLRALRFALAVLTGTLLGFLGAELVRAADAESVSHQHAEQVLAADFIARFNTWAWDSAQRGKEHFQTYDAREKRQLDEIRKAWRDFDEEMKHAGY